jgi:beta-phosphoglucomutase-like phosphatase (HAD superfamily)
MTTQTLTRLIIAALLAASAAGGLQVTSASTAAASVDSASPVRASCQPAGGSPYFLVIAAGDRVAASSAGPKPAFARTVRLIP